MDNIKNTKIKSWQLSSILRGLYRNPGITRMELSKNLKMDKSMVTRHINFLRQKGFIKKTNPKEKQIPIRLQEDNILVAGVEIQPEFQSCIISNLKGDILSQKDWSNPISNIREFIDTELTDYINSSEYSLKAIGIALPGPYQSATNTLLGSQPFGLSKPIQLPKLLKNCDCPVYYENDARCCGWGIVSFKKERENFVLILSKLEEIKGGATPEESKRPVLGFALFLNQKIREGSHSCAGDCSGMFKHSNKYKGYEHINHIDRIKMKTDPEMLDKTIREYARLISFIANFLDLGKIYVGGMLEEFKDVIEKRFAHYLLKNSSYPHIQKTEIAYTEFGEMSIAHGAAGFALETLFSEPSIGKNNPFFEEIIRESEQQSNHSL